MRVSIITPTFNSEATISSCLDSIKKQSYKNIEHIVKDGESTDNTVALVKDKSPDTIVIQGKDNGLYHALNIALEKVSGDIIGILHADDFYAHDSVLSDIVNSFVESGSDAVYGDLQYVSKKDSDKVIRNWISGQYSEGDFLKGWMPPHPAFFVKREVIEKFGAYDLSFKSAADYEWMLRLIHKNKIKLTYLPGVLVKMRVGGQSNKTIWNRIKANMEDRRAWKINGLSPTLYTLWLKPLRKLTQWK